MGNGNAVHRIDYTKLAYEAGRRGHDLSDLTLGPDRVGLDTLARIHRGGLVRLGTVRRIARKLTTWPVVADLDAVLAAPEQGSGSHRSNVGVHVPDAHRSLEPVPARGSEDA